MLVYQVLLSVCIKDDSVIVKASYKSLELKAVCNVDSYRYLLFSRLI